MIDEAAVFSALGIPGPSQKLSRSMKALYATFDLVVEYARTLRDSLIVRHLRRTASMHASLVPIASVLAIAFNVS